METIRSGLPILHTSFEAATKGGIGLPSGAPAATHSLICCFSRPLNRALFENLPCFGLACHGGMRPSLTTSAIISLHPYA